MVDTLDDAAGAVTAGTETFNFTGSMFNGLFEIQFSHPMDGFNQRLNLNVNLTLDRWNCLPLNELPYFNKVYELFNYLHDGYNLAFKMEIRGEHVFTTNITSFEGESYIENHFWYLSFLQICRKITRLLDVRANYKDQDHFSWEEHKELERVLARLERKYAFTTQHIKKNITCVLTIPTENLPLFGAMSDAPRSFQISYPDRQTIRVFDVDIALPRLILNVSNVIPKITRIVEKSAAEAKLEIEFIPAEGFAYSETYEMDS